MIQLGEQMPQAFSFVKLDGCTGRHGGLMVSAIVSGSSGPDSSPDQGHGAVFLGKTLYSHSASLHLGALIGIG